MASTIIQSYFKPILESYLTPNVNLRISVVNCLNQILNQGLIYPIECVPYLIAMTTDIEKKIQVKSLTHLSNLQKAHPGFIHSKSIGGLNMSYRLQKIIQATEKSSSSPSSSANNDSEVIVRGISDTNNEILSLNHHLYTLLRTQRSYRRAFIQQLLKMFDDTSSYHASLGHLLYICDNLAYFPYQLIDEPLYLIHQIDMIISITGVNILNIFKENLIKKKPKDGSGENGVQQEVKKISENDDEDTNKKCLDMDMSHICPDEELDDEEGEDGIKNQKNNKNDLIDAYDNIDNDETQLNKIQNNSKKLNVYDDDEEETIESIVKNLPVDLKLFKDCMLSAQGCCLLLILKQFLKEVYSITDAYVLKFFFLF